MAPNPTQTGDRGNGSRNIRDMINGDTSSNQNSRPSTPAVTPATTQGTTNKRLPPKLTIPEIIALKNEVIDATSGKKFLMKTKLASMEKPLTTDALKETLLHITQLAGITLPAQTAIRAVAFLLEGIQTENNSEATEMIARHVTAAISPHIAKLQDAEEKITKIADEVKASLTARDTHLEELQISIVKLGKQVTNAPLSKPSYATVLAAGQQLDPETQAQQFQWAAREAIKECQILVDFPTTSQLAAGKSSHAQLVEQIKKALSTPPKDDNTPELEIHSVNQFRQGGMVIEMMTKEAVEHIRNDTNTRRIFLQNLDAEATIKECTYTIVIPFTPVTFHPEDHSHLRTLEDKNGWKESVILSARWIKPTEKRRNDQQVAHALITLTDPSTANTAIHDGITMRQLKLWPKKNRKEPIRCAKCQHYGHIAKECIKNGDVCANCGNNHRTSDCTTKDKQFCTSCESNEHSSWDRNCPTYSKRCEETNRRYPDNSMPDFPTNEEWTQVSAPPRPPPYQKPKPMENDQPQQQHQQQPNANMQQRLDSYPTRPARTGDREMRKPSRSPTRN